MSIERFKKEEIRVQRLELPEKREKSRWDRLEEIIELSEEQKEALQQHIDIALREVAVDVERREVYFNQGKDFTHIAEDIINLERVYPGLLQDTVTTFPQSEPMKHSLIAVVEETEAVKKQRAITPPSEWILRHFFGYKEEPVYGSVAATERFMKEIFRVDSLANINISSHAYDLVLIDVFESALLSLEHDTQFTRQQLIRIKDFLEERSVESAELSLRFQAAALLKIIAPKENHTTKEDWNFIFEALREQQDLVLESPERFNGKAITALQILLADRVEADEKGIRFVPPKSEKIRPIEPPPIMRNF